MLVSFIPEADSKILLKKKAVFEINLKEHLLKQPLFFAEVAMNQLKLNLKLNKIKKDKCIQTRPKLRCESPKHRSQSLTNINN